MRKLLVISLSLFSLVAFSQGDQTNIQIPGVEPAILHLPPDYNSNPANHPLLVFLHGKGQGGTSPSLIYNSSDAGGPAYFIAQGTWPTSLPFIVVSPQYPSTTTGTSPAQLDAILQYLVKNYRIDLSRIYLTGLSEGGAAVANYLTHTGVTPSYKIAAAVIMSAAIGQPTQAQINQMATDKVGVWGFGSMTDIFGIQTKILVGGAFSGNGGTLVGLGSLGRFTSYAGGHCCWNAYYNPTYTEYGQNIYQWLLQYSSGAVPVTPPPVLPSKVDTTGIITAYLKTHPCPTVDSVAIGVSYLAAHPCPTCPPPVICPVCPAQRKAIKLVNDIVAGICYLTYDDGTTQQISK
jgi:hypothetical protein